MTFSAMDVSKNIISAVPFINPHCHHMSKSDITAPIHDSLFHRKKGEDFMDITDRLYPALKRTLDENRIFQVFRSLVSFTEFGN